MVMEQNAQLLRTKNDKLEKLCRALQAERNQLRKQDKTVRSVDVTYLCIPHLSPSLSTLSLPSRKEVMTVERSQERKIKHKKTVLERRHLVVEPCS